MPELSSHAWIGLILIIELLQFYYSHSILRAITQPLFSIGPQLPEMRLRTGRSDLVKDCRTWRS